MQTNKSYAEATAELAEVVRNPDEFDDELPFEHDEQSAHYQDWERNR